MYSPLAAITCCLLKTLQSSRGTEPQEFSQALSINGIDVLIDLLRFYKINLGRAFYQIQISRGNASFVECHTTPFGLFTLLRMPSRLHKASQTAKVFVNRMLHGLSFVDASIDGLLLLSFPTEDHMEHFAKVFDRLQNLSLFLTLPSVFFRCSLPRVTRTPSLLSWLPSSSFEILDHL
uniref:Reverse transcriptase domain-containing protein n=1 Tax=Schistocephalus solidus TaxID=70667 RepID=A0A0X3P4Y7_SCHSO